MTDERRTVSPSARHIQWLSMKRMPSQPYASVTLVLAVGAMGPASPAHARAISASYEAKLNRAWGRCRAQPLRRTSSPCRWRPRWGGTLGWKVFGRRRRRCTDCGIMEVAWRDVNPQPGVFDWSILDRPYRPG